MDYINYSPEEESAPAASVLQPYKILVVDDEEEVHKITDLLLRDLVLDGHGIQLISTYSFREAREALNLYPDIAVALVDVVMETNHAGLELIRYIREEVHNRKIRLILRTGQPGVAPEEQVIIDYDINDYKSKTELTYQRLVTSVVSCIRSYRDISVIDRNQKGLRRIIDASSQLLDYHEKTTQEFMDGLLTQLILFYHFNEAPGELDGLVLLEAQGQYIVAAGSGTYKAFLNQPLDAVNDDQARAAIDTVGHDRSDKLLFGEHHIVSYHVGYEKQGCIIYLRCSKQIDQDLMRIFMGGIIQAMDNFILNNSILTTEREVISTLSEIVEKRDMSTANHIKRVSEYAYILGKRLGMDAEDCGKLKIACMMHDVGKIGINDHILLKPQELSKEEFEIIKGHTSIGHRILATSSLSLMKMAADIALNHHERWDGTGYPQQLKGEAIPLSARLISVLDVFDALTHKRIYKDPWPMDEALAYIRDQREKMFDPQLVDLFFDSMEQIQGVWHQYPD